MRLPDLQFAAVGPARLTGPGEAVIESNQKLALVNQAQAGVAQFAEDKRKYELDTAFSNAQDYASEFRKEAAKEWAVTPEQITAWELDGQVNTEGRKVVPKNEWYPVALQKVQDDALRMFGETIQNPQDRAFFFSEFTRAGNEIITREIELVQAEARAEDKALKKASYEEAVSMGRFETAATILKDDAFSPAERIELSAIARTEKFAIDSNAIINTGSTAEISAYLQQLTDPETRASFGVTERTAQVFTNRAQAEIQRREADYEARAAKSDVEREKVARELTTQLKSAVATGRPIPEQWEREAENVVQGTPYEDTFRIIKDTQVYAVQPASQRAAKLQELGAAPDLSNQEEYEAYVAANIEIQKAATKDGYAFGVEQGLIDPVPLSLGDPDTWKKRRDQAQDLSLHYGVPVSPISNNEAAEIAQAQKSMTVGEQMQLIGTFAETPEVFAQLTKTGASVFAVAGASQDPDLARIALTGQKMLDNKTAVKPSAKDYLLLTNDYLGPVYGTDDRAAIIETATAVYATLAPAGDPDTGEFSPDLWEQALATVTGGVEEVNGGKVQIPRGTSADTLQTFVDSFSADQVQQYGGIADMDPEAAALLIQDGEWESVGNDRYRVRRGGLYLMSPARDGAPAKPFEVIYDSDAATNTAAKAFAERQRRGTGDNITDTRGMR